MISCKPIFPDHLSGVVTLPSSKSISARALVISALAGKSNLSNLSDCDDTCVLRKALVQRLPVIDIQAAGTAMRFSTAYFAACEGEDHVITGSERMLHRPIQVLVDALRLLGADITYMGKEGYPPLRIHGKHLHGGCIELPANVSSQYISALLMVGPVLDGDLHLHLIGEVISRPYIDMTVGLMKAFGADVAWTSENELVVRSTSYTSDLHFIVEPDWSGASYWYEMVALTLDQNARIVLSGLSQKSLQGDSVVAKIFTSLGVQTIYENENAILSKNGVLLKKSLLELDFTTCPDLAQTLVVTCALLGQPFRFVGLQSLRIKETDRILALQTELKKIGVNVVSTSYRDGNNRIEVLQMLEPQSLNTDAEVEIATYDDHRMAMAFAPAVMKVPKIRIAHPEVVSKSYPSFWEDVQALGADNREL